MTGDNRDGDNSDDHDVTQVIRTRTSLAPNSQPRRDRCALTVISGPATGTVFEVQDEVVIGRGAECSMRIDDDAMSRRHVRVFRLGENYIVEDLESTNGTFVNGRAIEGPTQLRDADRVLVGKATMLTVSLQDALEHQVTRGIYEAAVRDGLTGLYNRRFFDERLQSEFAFAARHSVPLSVLLLDIDHFKKLNDTFGHPAGDSALRQVGQTIASTIRTEDLAARYGGEEFVVLARGTDAPHAFVLAERLRAKIRRSSTDHGGIPLQVTVSIGVATLSTETPYPGADPLIAAADRALYRAKEGGRDQSVCGD